jgi:hypothetical protein
VATPDDGDARVLDAMDDLEKRRAKRKQRKKKDDDELDLDKVWD